MISSIFYLQQIIYSLLLILGNYFYLMILVGLQTLKWFQKTGNKARPVTRALVRTDNSSADTPMDYLGYIYIYI